MTPERWREVRAAFEQWVELGDPERTARLLSWQTSDPELAAELVALLAAEGRASPLLAGSIRAVGAPSSNADSGPQPGDRVGAWELLGPLGEGGMGRVFLARRADQAFEKLAAIKFVRAAFLSPLVRERLRVERQLLAALEHPGIARLLDGGESTAGEPYLVLEYVEGSSLLEFAAEQSLDRRARVVLFRQVLAAVSFAHRQLIVHRDLKPGNILVTRDGTVKLLDFGIAKLLEPDGDTQGATAFGLRALTPEYASPEQILGAPTATASDVYALGLVLFELLAGKKLYQVPTASPEAWAEATLHQEPARDLGLGPDLDAVVQRATRKRAAERYASADAFDDDLERWLSGRPVAARAGGARDRAIKFGRRNALPLTLGAAAVVALVVTVTVAGLRLERERDRAHREARTARQVADFLVTMFQKADPVRARGAALTAREILDQGVRGVGAGLVGEPEIEARLLVVLGAVERDLGLLAEARPLLERSLALQSAGDQETDPLARAEALHELGVLARMEGDLEAAARHLDGALEIRAARLPANDLMLAATLSARGLVFRLDGDLARARPLLERAVAIARERAPVSLETGRWLNHLGLLHQDAGDFEPARRLFAESLATLEASEGAESPVLAIPLDNLGSTLKQLGRSDEALPYLERALRLVETSWGANHPQRGNALNSLGAALSELGRQGEAIELFRRAAEVYAAALGSEHAYVAWPLRNQGEALLGLGRPREAIPLFERALALRRRAHGENHPETALALTDLGHGHAIAGDLVLAESYLRQGLERSRATMSPTDIEVAEAMVFLADVLARKGDRDEAGKLYLEALPLLRHAFEANDARIVEVEARLAALG